MDIKPQNIMFSPSRKELVFIDFGLSAILKEGIGTKTKTTFVGTINYCSPEMKKLFHPKESLRMLIDLYHNDVCSLEISLAEIADLWNHH
jgi:serine/threonine protein kinase